MKTLVVLAACLVVSGCYGTAPIGWGYGFALLTDDSPPTPDLSGMNVACTDKVTGKVIHVLTGAGEEKRCG